MENYKQLSLYEAFIKGATGNENNPCLLYSGKTFDYAYVRQQTEKTAEILVNAEIKQGDIITLVLPNIPQALYLIYAANKLGAVVHLIHALSTKEQLADNINKTSSRYVFAMNVAVGNFAVLAKEQNLKLFSVSPAGELSKLEQFIYKRANKIIPYDDVVDFDSLLRTAAICNGKLVERDLRKTSFLFNGSGTNGISNTIELSDYAINSLCELGLTILETSTVVGKYMSSFLPLFHPFGFTMCMHAINIFGGCNVFIPRFSREAIIKLIYRRKLNYIVGVPSVYFALLSHPKFKGRCLRTLEVAFVGGDSVSLSLLDNFNKRMQESGSICRLLQGYGPSETCSATCVNTLSKNRRGSCGIPQACTKYRIFDETTSTLKTSGLGELYIGGDSLFNGYYANHEANEQCVYVDVGGDRYLKSGDVVEISEDGYVTFKSRIKRIIKVSGFAVFPNQIEQVAVSFDGISRACALGFTDPITMSKVVLFYETLDKKKIDEIKLLVVLKKHLEPKAVPSEIRFTEKTPLTPYNKIDVGALRKLYEEIKTM